MRRSQTRCHRSGTWMLYIYVIPKSERTANAYGDCQWIHL
jgi:hypothetical protein